jgi:hypothetical protein
MYEKMDGFAFYEDMIEMTAHLVLHAAMGYDVEGNRTHFEIHSLWVCG